nr:phage portal protein [uncultured Dysosmobacter sp.]
MANWLDSAIAFFSPSWGARRAAWRGSFEEMRNYDAGSNARLNANWRVSNASAEMTDRGYRDIIRARARDLERNSDLMASVTGPYKRNVVGRGFQLQAATKRSTLNKELEKHWKRWTQARNCDVTGTQSLNQILRMAVVRKKIDGGILFVKRYTSAGIVPFQIQMLEVDELDTMQTGTKANGNRVIGGIEYNRYNRPVGYWFRQYSIDGFSITEPVYVPAKDVIFYFDKKRPSQIREVSDMSQTITRIRDTNEFMTAVSVKERIAACLAVFIKKTFPPMTGGTFGRPATGQGAEERFSYDGKMLTPGMIKEMNVGDEAQVVNPTGQATDATAFTKLQQRMIGAGQGLSYEATSRDMSETNYASARQGIIEDELTYVEEEEQIIAILDEIYETFVISCVLSQLVTIPDFWDKKDDYLAHKWIKQPKKWIDPLKESSATKTALNTGQKTFKQIAAEEGTDWRQQIDDTAEVLEYARKKGIDLEGVIFDGKAKAAQEPEPEPQPEPGEGGTEPAGQDGKEPAAGEGSGEDVGETGSGKGGQE